METTTHKVTQVMPADSPDDGGKWAMYCEHTTADGDVFTGVLQDTNKRRLSSWRNHSIDWCCYCQNERDYGMTDPAWDTPRIDGNTN